MRTAPAIFATLLAMSPAAANAQAVRDSRTILVTAPGGGGDRGAASESDADIARDGGADLLGALARDLPEISLADAQSNPFQPNLVYRGFSASPLQGNPQGLAVYVDDVRFNQPFGDTVDFDLLPDSAIASVELRPADPVYGLNALAGALAIETATGASAPGVRAAFSAGDHGRRHAAGSAGLVRGRWSLFAAVSGDRDGGWRRHSPSRRANGFADLGFDGARAGIHAKLIAADTDLTGNGSAPVELLAADRRAVFTWPDETRNRFARLSLHPWVELDDATRIEASLYAQRLRQHTLNGDAADIERCDEPADAGLLCLESGEDDSVRLVDDTGAPVPDLLDGGSYGLLNRSTTQSRAAGLLVQAIDERALPWGSNRLVVGLSRDRSRTRFASESGLGALTDARSVDALGPVVTQPDGSITPVALIARTRTTALFLVERAPVAHGVTVETSLRWNDVRIGLDDRIGTALDGEHRFRRLDPSAAVELALVPGATLRLGYAETSRAPAPAELACADPGAPCSLTNFFVGDPPLAQVVARSWEVRAWGRTGGAWSVEWRASAYSTATRNDIQFVASGTRGRAYFANVGATRRRGAELAVRARHSGWSIRLGYALSDARFAAPLTLSSPDNPAADDSGRIAVARGDRLPGVPLHRALLSIERDHGGLALGADLVAQSGQRLFGDEGNDRPPTRGFVTLAVHARVPIAPGLDLFGEVTNLLDARYATFGTFSETGEVDLAEAPGASDPRSLGPGAPRRFRLGARARF